MITGHQLKSARALLGWSGTDLAHNAGTGASTIRRMEHSGATLIGPCKSLARVLRALEENGIGISADSDGYAIRLRKAQAGAPLQPGVRITR